MSEVKPSEYSTEYNPNKGWNCKRLCDGNDRTYYDEKDLYIMTGDVLDLYNDVKHLCKELDFHMYESFEKDEYDNYYLRHINFDKFEFTPYSNDAGNKIEFSARLNKPFDENMFRNRLQEFKEFLLKIKNNEVDLKNRKQLISDELDLTWDKKQLDIYDYNFYF
jgi:hypothetical protein